MSTERSGSKPGIPGKTGTNSGESSEPDSPQLSGEGRVSSSVSSVAMNAGFLGLGGVGRSGQGSSSAPSTPLQAASDEGLTDAEVMLRVKAGDQAAFDYLVQKYRRAMISFMYRMAHNSGAAEDLAQEVFLRVYRSRETYTASAKFTTWLYRIATNLAANYARDTRHEKPENTVSLDQPDEETGLTMDVPDSSLNVEQNILRQERLAAIRKHVQDLPERQRMAVIMHKYQAMDYRQIAEVLHLSESATKSLLFRAYETLREKLKDFV
jgi:RNA polymerase sigma-70 factor (ECF subfamily)